MRKQPLLLCTAALTAALCVPASAATKKQPDTGLSAQTAVVDWSKGEHDGKDTAGFVLPGIGRGKITCSPTAQYVRIYPTRQNRETSMMEWTYKDWGKGKESAIREDLKTKFSGPTFREGLNKFSPAEKEATGQYDGIVSDRGPLGGAGGTTGLAKPTGFKLTWEWDFSDEGKSRCYVKGVFNTERASSEKTPLARSAQVLWRGDANAPGRDTAAVKVPGLGAMTLTCQPGFDGERSIVIDTEEGATITTREGSDSETVPQQIGPVLTDLPNNGMVFVAFDDGRQVVLSSRWKVNDPDGAQNSCAVAAQATTP